MTSSDIVAAHRLPQGSAHAGPRPVLVKFLKRSKKEAVIRNRKKLRGKRMGIVDDLCREYQQMMNRANKDDRVKACWYWNGKVFIVNEAGQKGQLRYQQPLTDALEYIETFAPLPPQADDQGAAMDAESVQSGATAESDK